MGLAMARRTKRLWTVEEKRSICLQTTAPGVSVAQVARRYALNANLIFKWLRDPRFAPDPDASPDGGSAAFFPSRSSSARLAKMLLRRAIAREPGGTIEIDRRGRSPDADQRPLRSRGSCPADPGAVRVIPVPERHEGLAGGRGDGHAPGLHGAGGAGRQSERTGFYREVRSGPDGRIGLAMAGGAEYPAAHGLVAQLDRALDYKSRGRGFKSLSVRQFLV